MTDPIGDMLARLRNAAQADHETVEMPASRQKVDLARILKAEGYIRDYETGTDAHGHPIVRISLKYGRDRQPAISGMRRVSKPGRRVYTKSDSLPKVLGGMGTAILSTSSGVMTDRDAKRAKVGGEVVAYIW